MSILKKTEQWGDRHHPAILDIIRIALGLFLLLKGYAFLQNRPFLEDMIIDLHVKFLTPGMVVFMMNYVIWVHMVGGLLIMLGIFTRLASLLQLPIICTAFYVINDLRSALNSDLWLTIFTLLFLLIFTILGSGPLSFDRYLGKDKKE
jgi:putative oxidoreductase